MKHIQRILLLLLLLSQNVFSQAKIDPDVLIKLNGDTLKVKVINITDYDLTYSYPGETVTYTVNKNQVNKIYFSSGREERINEKVDISGEEDWQKVHLTTLGSDVKGMNLKGEITSKVNTGGFRSVENQHSIAEERFKREAAKVGAHLVLLETKVHQGAFLVWTGKAYGY